MNKLAREIISAAKACNGDRADLRLDNAISRARSLSMPVKNIDAAVQKGTQDKDGTNFESYQLEGHGPGQVAVIVQCLTDNKKRTAPRVRSAFTKFGGQMGSSGAVEWMFERQGNVAVKATAEEEESILDSIIEVDDELLDIDFEEAEDGSSLAVVICQPTNLALIKGALAAADFQVEEADIIYNPTQLTAVADGHLEDLESFFGMLDEEEDVQRYFHTAEISDDA
jgi:YebC/PmpR family DNA-binding regulatory protein